MTTVVDKRVKHGQTTAANKRVIGSETPQYRERVTTQ